MDHTEGWRERVGDLILRHMMMMMMMMMMMKMMVDVPQKPTGSNFAAFLKYIVIQHELYFNIL